MNEDEFLTFVTGLLNNIPEISVNFFTKDYILTNAFSCIRKVSDNSDIVKRSAGSDFEDLEEYIRVYVPEGTLEDAEGSIIIRKNHCEALNITEDVLSDHVYCLSK